VDPKVALISALLHQAAETHHVVFAITDGTTVDRIRYTPSPLGDVSRWASPRSGRDRRRRTRSTPVELLRSTRSLASLTVTTADDGSNLNSSFRIL
jgi:hypothetical protein